MPKKNRGENTKAVEARARKDEKKSEERERKERAIEDAKWEDNDKHVLRKQGRTQQKESAAAEKAARKAELKAAYDADMAMAASVTTSAKNQTAKLTRAEMQRRIDEESRKSETASGLPPPTHLETPLEENLNRLQVEDSARTVDEAIHVLGAEKITKEDKNPEKRLQAAYKAFEEKTLPRVKAENKNMRLSQWKQVVWKEWTKSPDNPLNQAKLRQQNENLGLS